MALFVYLNLFNCLNEFAILALFLASSRILISFIGLELLSNSTDSEGVSLFFSPKLDLSVSEV